MRILFQLSLIICSLLIVANIPTTASSATNAIDWSDPESIDIYQEDIGDFLDADVSEFAKKAQELYTAGEYEDAAKYYLAVLRYDINDGMSLYNLACCYGLLGDAELAAKYVKRAVNAGFEDIGHIRWDPDFDSVRDSDVFSSAVDELAKTVEEKQEALGDVIHFDSPAFFECRIKLPDNYDPGRKYTLMVGLHGYGSNPDRFITLWDKFETHDFIYVSPRGPYPFMVGKNIGYSWAKGFPEHRLMSERAQRMTEDYIGGVMRNMKHQYNIGDTYLMGFSQGCAFTYMAGIKHHDLLDGLICFGGWLDDGWIGEKNINAAKHLRVFIGHGTEDRMVEYDAGVEARDYLTEHGYDVTFFDFDGAHAVPEDEARAAEKWMRK